VILEGNLSEYPLRELLTILGGKRETGRLELDLESATGNLYLAKGQLVDARVGSLQGLSAVNVIVAAEEAAFTFHQLPNPPTSAFNENEQALLSRLIGLDREENEGLRTPLRQTVPPSSPVEGRPLFASLTEADNSAVPSLAAEPELALSGALTQPQVMGQQRWLEAKDAALSFAVSAAKQSLLYVQRHNLAFAFVFVLFVVPAIIAITVRLGVSKTGAETHTVVQGAVPSTNDATATASDNNPKVAVEPPSSATEKTVTETAAIEAKKSGKNDPAKSATEKQKQSEKEKQKAAVNSTPLVAKKEDRVAKKEETKSDPVKNEPDTYSIVVMAKIENGHVTEASVTNHKAGLDAYEATAIRLAQQRRFPKDKTGTERIVLTVSK